MDNKSNAAFYYLTEGYQTAGKSLMGRHSAGEGFLKGFVRHAAVEKYFCYAPDERQFHHFRQTVAEVTGRKEACVFIPFEQFYILNRIGCLYLPGPGLSNDAWVRRSFNSRAYSLCGVTHTTASDRIMDSIGSLLTDPVQSWDAIVCTSTVVRKTLERVIGEYSDYLIERLGVRPDMPVQLPIIPLGVDCDQYSQADGDTYRKAWRDKLGIGPEDIAVLYMGRFSFSTKVHPLPMFLALEEAARRTTRKIVLLLAGWFDPPPSEAVWKQDVQKFCPSITTVFLDGRQTDIRKEIWSTADIFTSLSDNIQETFGLTPIEAMAAGLPVVVTDWNGYRDTVRHGIDGFRIPVLMPEPGIGEDIAIRYANKIDVYGRYCGIVSQMTSVDVSACIAAFTSLIDNMTLRKQMGEAGRMRARSEYDWSVVVKKYQDLWLELAARRLYDRETAPLKKGKPSQPLRIDPFTLFQEYPTGHITNAGMVSLKTGKQQGWYEHITSSSMNNYINLNGKLILSREDQDKICNHLTQHAEASVAELAGLFPKTRNYLVKRTLGWMAKNDFIDIRLNIPKGRRTDKV